MFTSLIHAPDVDGDLLYYSDEESFEHLDTLSWADNTSYISLGAGPIVFENDEETYVLSFWDRDELTEDDEIGDVRFNTTVFRAVADCGPMVIWWSDEKLESMNHRLRMWEIEVVSTD